MEEYYIAAQAFYTREPQKMEIHFYPDNEEKPCKVYHVASESWTESNRFMGIPLRKHGAIIKQGEQWVLLPGKEPEFLFVDEKSGERTYCGGFEKVLRPYSQMPEENLFTGGMAKINDCIYLLSYRINKLLEFQLETKQWKLYDIGTNQRRYSIFFYDETDFWFLAWDGSCVVRWNKETGNTRVYDKMPEGYLAFSNAFVNPYTPAFFCCFTTPQMEEAATRNGTGSPYFYREQGLHCTLKDMMDYFASGADMQAARQREASTEGVANADGTCGMKVHDYISEQLK